MCCPGGPLLAALVSGDAGAEFEKQSPEAIVQRVLSVLERIFKPKGINVPQPVQVLPGLRQAALHVPPSAIAVEAAASSRCAQQCSN